MVMSRVARAFRIPSLLTPLPVAPEWHEDPIGRYHLLRAYYGNNGLYDDLRRTADSTGMPVPALKSLRNPAHRVVEFYVAHLWSDLEVETPDEAVAEAIDEVWKWSNWDAKRLLAARWFARDGDLFIKVVSRRHTAEQEGRVRFQLLDAATVVDFDKDSQGHVTFVRIETPTQVRVGDDLKDALHVEIWDERRGTFRRWELPEGHDASTLPTPTEELALREFGIDFIPIVHAPFIDTGDLRGQAAITHALEKIDEANLQATRLHQMLFRHNDAVWALSANAMDASGRPVPPPQVSGRAGTSTDDGIIEIAGEKFYRLPGMSKLESLVPDLKYDAALSILNAMMLELEADLPELAVRRLREQGDLSGRAVQLLLSDSVARVVEARGNGETALVRADQMALTMGKAADIPAFAGLGTYESGALDHRFREQDAIPVSEETRWETERVKAEAAVAQQRSGLSVDETLRQRGYTDEEIARMGQEREADRAGQFERLLDEFNRGGGADS